MLVELRLQPWCRSLGLWQLTAIGFSGVIGSGGLVGGRFTAAGGWWPRSSGWGIWIAYATNPPSESAAML